MLNGIIDADKNLRYF